MLRVEHRLFGAGVVACREYLHAAGLIWGWWCVVESVGGWLVSDTLLGPEGSGASLDLMAGTPDVCWGWWLWASPGGGLRDGVLVGMTGWWGTARMLRTTQWTRASLWLKFLRAHGGCLGTRNRRRT